MDAKSARTLNIRHFVKEAGGPTPFANKFGNGRWSQEQVSQWISEKQPKSIGNNLARALEEAIGLPFGAFDTAPDQPGRLITAFHPEDPSSDEEVRIPESRVVKFSGGHGHIPTYETVEDAEPATYRLSWFQKERINPAKTKRFRVVGSSMEPLLWPGDSVLVNLEETKVKSGLVYVFRHGEELKVKRLFQRNSGELVLRSTNSKKYPDDVIPSEQIDEQITIIGCVRDKSGRGGLSASSDINWSEPELGPVSATINTGGIDRNLLIEAITFVDMAIDLLDLDLNSVRKSQAISEVYEAMREDSKIPQERMLRLVKRLK